MFVGSGIYLVLCLLIVNHYGLGLLSYMENMYLSENGNITQVIKAVLMNPGYTLRQGFDVKEKIDYMIWLLLPVNAAILSTKKYSNYILLLPCILLNIIPDYSCVYSIYFQYSFSVSALLFYIVIMNISAWKSEKRKNYLLLALGITAFLFIASVWQMTGYYKEKYEENENIHKTMEEMLNTIPQEASVGASNTLTAHLWKNLELYTAFTADTEYIVLDLRAGQGLAAEDARAQALQSGYIEIDYKENAAIIFRKE